MDLGKSGHNFFKHINHMKHINLKKKKIENY